MYKKTKFTICPPTFPLEQMSLLRGYGRHEQVPTLVEFIGKQLRNFRHTDGAAPLQLHGQRHAFQNVSAQNRHALSVVASEMEPAQGAIKHCLDGNAKQPGDHHALCSHSCFEIHVAKEPAEGVWVIKNVFRSSALAAVRHMQILMKLGTSDGGMSFLPLNRVTESLKSKTKTLMAMFPMRSLQQLEKNIIIIQDLHWIDFYDKLPLRLLHWDYVPTFSSAVNYPWIIMFNVVVKKELFHVSSVLMWRHHCEQFPGICTLTVPEPPCPIVFDGCCLLGQ
mmetsp:Transcript_48832/g.97145  ORF Transcript_48832/g.97145 Transcript_48832/m.97145 type:complete len:279 (+) Transcript_48832:1117-1953(+)